MGCEGIRLFERTHLSDQNPQALYSGPSRGLRCNSIMESTSFYSSRPKRGSLAA